MKKKELQKKAKIFTQKETLKYCRDSRYINKVLNTRSFIILCVLEYCLILILLEPEVFSLCH